MTNQTSLSLLVLLSPTSNATPSSAVRSSDKEADLLLAYPPRAGE
jgi:hypothetical protein